MTTIFFGDGNDDWEPSENDELLNEEDEWHGAAETTFSKVTSTALRELCCH